MRTLTIIQHISLDGVIQHSADGGAFPYDDWKSRCGRAIPLLVLLVERTVEDERAAADSCIPRRGGELSDGTPAGKHHD
jgi:hypothetical protein